MKRITIDNIANAISLSWSVAHKAEDTANLMHRWGAIKSELSGMFSLINYSDMPHGEHQEELFETIELLRDIARYHWMQS